MSEPTVSRPIIGDPGYLELLDHVHAAGQVTDRERRERRLIHLHLRRVRRERPFPGDDGYVQWLEGEFDAGRVDGEQATELLHQHQIRRSRGGTS
jgi:hypothetical protein